MFDFDVLLSAEDDGTQEREEKLPVGGKTKTTKWHLMEES